MPPDHKIIRELVDPSSSVLDLGCGTGELLSLLVKEKHVKAQGIEIDDKAIFECVAKGLSVFHDDIDTGLPEYGDKSFDFVILNQSLQQVKKIDVVLKEALRVGRKVIVGIPNFAYINARFQIFFKGRVPVTPSLPFEWYNTPNLHFLSLYDFIEYCRKQKIIIDNACFLDKKGQIRLLPNLFAQIGIFVLRENKTDKENESV
ncbi:MAG: methionine biosynthesis protein MetW [Syntrophus sp. (in: bacteria)]|nr:methionine biosynthesis protein MetW [Syntrophus sp. (in: bacteria)]